MKKILLLIACVLTSIGSVGAMEINNKLSLLDVPYSEEELKEMAKENDSFEIARSELCTITSYATNSLGQIVEENTIIATEEEANMVKEDDSLYVNNKGELQRKSPLSTMSVLGEDGIHTESKWVMLIYSYNTTDGYVVTLSVIWEKLPKIRVFDIMALMWSNNVTIKTISGRQNTDQEITYYDSTTKNLKKGTNAMGLSMNLHNNAKNYIALEFKLTSKSPFGDIYGSYQHARHSNATLAISKSYTFNSKGLGGVVYFSNSTYKSYYDNTPGVSVIG